MYDSDLKLSITNTVLAGCEFTPSSTGDIRILCFSNGLDYRFAKDYWGRRNRVKKNFMSPSGYFFCRFSPQQRKKALRKFNFGDSKGPRRLVCQFADTKSNFQWTVLKTEYVMAKADSVTIETKAPYQCNN